MELQDEFFSDAAIKKLDYNEGRMGQNGLDFPFEGCMLLCPIAFITFQQKKLTVSCIHLL
jgi:hypothetical protein